MWVSPTYFEKIVSGLKRLFSRQPPAMPPLADVSTLTRLYASSMFDEGNFLHRQIIRRMVTRIGLDAAHLETLTLKAAQGAFVFVTINLGQLEYNIFNQIFLKQNLPLAQFNNRLRTRQWWPLKKIRENFRQRIRCLKEYGNIPDPLQSGYLKNMLKSGNSCFLSLDDFDPSYLSTPTKDMFHQVFLAANETERPLFAVPVQVVWDKRPRRDQPTVYESLFGETERPGWLRKLILFVRHYRNRALVKFGEPIPLRDFLATAGEKPELGLYQKILGSLTIEKRILTGPLIRPRNWFLERIFEDENLNRLLYEVAREKKKPFSWVQRIAHRYAKEIAADVHYSRIEFGVALIDFWSRFLFDKISVDPEGLQRLKKILSRGPTVLVPNHRSHFDYLLMAYLCYQNDIVVPHVAAGINMAFWPLGKYFRRCGAFFLRRTFSGNKLYKKVFQTYLKVLIQEGYLQEFFIEGGRSRTGKLRAPRLGMLSMYTDAMHEQAARDIHFVPTSITYDRVIEQESYLKEIEGGAKPKEKTGDLLRLGRFLKRRYGNIYVRFDEPISWQQVASDIQESAWEKKRPVIVEMLAQKISHAINRQVVVIPQALAATALLTSGKEGVPREKVLGLYRELHHYLQWKQVKLSSSFGANPDDAFLQAIDQFEKSGFVKSHQGLDQIFFEIVPSKRHDLDAYKNVAIHYFVSLALWSNLLLTSQSQTVSRDHLAEPYTYFKQLFQYEFRFSTRLPLTQHLDKLCCYLQERKVVEYNNGEIMVHKEGLNFLEVYSQLLRNFVEAYGAAWKTYLLRPTSPMDEKNLTKEILHHAKHLLMLGEIRHPEAVSQTIFENAIASFKKLGLFAQDSHAAKKMEESLEKLLTHRN